MSEILILTTLFAVIAGLALLEYVYHTKNLLSIPVRIHVNGTRGKSSVTRLIAAGLREAGIKTFAKTTGTLPRVIIHDGTEYSVFRKGAANIIEQVRIVAFAARNKAEALVIECMALQPGLQALCELKIIRATHGVITNVREDHLDTMGPEEPDVARALLGTTPAGKTLFTCEKDYPEEFREVCRGRGTGLVVVTNEEIESVQDSDINEFRYVEHKENIALALKVCAAAGVPADVAMRGMKKAAPDMGSLSDVSLNFFGRRIHFINGFAANDPESTETIWRMALEKHPNVESRVMVINNRLDRPDRLRQMGSALTRWPMADRYIMIGSGSYFFIQHAVKSGIDPRVFSNAEDLNIEMIFEEILKHCKKTTLVMGIGNIAGPGIDLVSYFRNRSEEIAV